MKPHKMPTRTGRNLDRATAYPEVWKRVGDLMEPRNRAERRAAARAKRDGDRR